MRKNRTHLAGLLFAKWTYLLSAACQFITTVIGVGAPCSSCAAGAINRNRFPSGATSAPLAVRGAKRTLGKPTSNLGAVFTSAAITSPLVEV